MDDRLSRTAIFFNDMRSTHITDAVVLATPKLYDKWDKFILFALPS